MEQPKLVIVDLDGTVVPHGLEMLPPSPAVVKALASVRAAGVPVAVATGRAVWGALRAVKDLDLTDGLISATHGAVTYDLGDARVVDCRLMDPSEAVRRFKAADPEVAFAVELNTRGWRHTDNFKRDFTSTWADMVDLETLAATQTARLAARLPGGARYGAGLRCPSAAKLAADADLDSSMYYVEVGFNGWIDVGPAGITKATGAAAVAAHYGVSAAETVVFGDAGNDLPMFAWAGHAVAMGQAVDEIKAAADEVAPSVDDDGVAAVLRRWFE
ncbi:MAG: HAD family hydrolase [Stackebrandtia sp.]